MCVCNCFVDEALRERHAVHRHLWIGRFSIPHLCERVKSMDIIRLIQPVHDFIIRIMSISIDQLVVRRRVIYF
jgi:hypothetical protein